MTTMPAVTTLPERFFAVYFDAVRYPAHPDPLHVHAVDDWDQRWQWIVMPRAPGFGRDDPFYVFSRYQNAKSHKAVWRNSPYRNYQVVLDSYSQVVRERHLTTRDPIVVELAPFQVTEYVVGSRKTPWEVINRAKRAATRLGYTI